jgi:hypothetical protein
MCLRRAPEKYIAGAALDRAGLGEGAWSLPNRYSFLKIWPMFIATVYLILSCHDICIQINVKCLITSLWLYHSVSWQSVSTFIRGVWLYWVRQYHSSAIDFQQSSMARTLGNTPVCIGTWSSCDGIGCRDSRLSRRAGSPCRWSRVETPIRYISAANAHRQDDSYGWLKVPRDSVPV